jgi:glucose-6-phosphate 1-dehydrogenase
MTNAHPTTIVVFGATGDLFRKKLAPALLELFNAKKLPQFFRVVAFSRRSWGDQEFRDFLRESLSKEISSLPSEVSESFFNRISYVLGEFHNLESYKKVAEVLEKIDNEAGVCTSKLFYLATPPASYEVILNNISKSGLSIPCSPEEAGSGTGWTRILIEKPFGNDLKSAEKLDLLLGQLFSEEQIFRIDHYLAKDIMRSVLQFRFSSGPFEKVWNSEFIDRVEVKLLEKDGIGSRGASYDGVGALRDVGQNHLFQMAALVALKNLDELSAGKIRNSRAQAIEQFYIPDDADITRGQYEGFLGENAVSPNSQTETYFKFVLGSLDTRWKETKFVFESGKALGRRAVEIVIHFRKPYGLVCPVDAICSGTENTITFDLLSKSTNFEGDAYEQVLLDAILGDQSLFTSTEEVMAEWKLVEDIFKKWEKIPLVKYKKGGLLN